MRRVGACAVALTQLCVSSQPSTTAQALRQLTTRQPHHHQQPHSVVSSSSSLLCSQRAHSSRATRGRRSRHDAATRCVVDATTTTAAGGGVSAAAAAAAAAARALWLTPDVDNACKHDSNDDSNTVAPLSALPSPLPVQPDAAQGNDDNNDNDKKASATRRRTPRRTRAAVATSQPRTRQLRSKAGAAVAAAAVATTTSDEATRASDTTATAAVTPPTPHVLDTATAMTLPTAAAIAEHVAATTTATATTTTTTTTSTSDVRARKRRARAATTDAAPVTAAAEDVDDDDDSDEHTFFANVLQHASGAASSSNNNHHATSSSSSSALSPRSFEETTLVYNALTGRMTSEVSPTMLQLKEVGFGVNAQRHLCVRDAAALNAFASRVRAGTATLSAKWPATLTRTLASVFGNANLPDAAQAIQHLMQVKINSVTRSRYASVVVAAPDGECASNSSASDASAEGNNSSSHDAEQQQQQQHSSSVASLIDDEAANPTRGVELNAEQERVIDIALRGHHLYIGGSAGTGKTVLLRVLSRRLQAHRLRVAMTATTGVAGCHVGGCTFHHAFGVSARGEFLRKGTLLDYDVIIIDEVSMLPQRLFEDFDRALRAEAGTPDVPFGGVQIILCGDFLQLGCVYEASIIHSRLFRDHFVTLRLQTQVRQSAHPKFADDLQRMRLGDVPADLTQTIRQLPPGTMVQSAVNLLPTNKEVHVANAKELERLPGEALTLSPETGITALACETTATLLLRTTPRFVADEFARHVRALLQATLDLPRASLLSLYKIYEDGHAMRVMLPPGESVAWREAMRERFLEVASLLNDLELGATVREIVPSGDGLHTPECEEYLQRLMAKHPIAQPLTFKKGCRVLLRANLSSTLVNGSIGTVVDYAPCKPDSFASYLRNGNVDACIERYRVFCETECGMPTALVPVVRFHSGETVAVPPWEFAVGGMASTHYYSLSSVALPLSLAYAFTVHKVQGLTLVGRVHLELSRMWPCDHLLYVAMSRVRNPEQLSMSSFTPAMVVANADCVRFDRQLHNACDVSDATLSRYTVAAWKRCNDTLYYLRRRGTSLRKLLEQVTQNSQQQHHQQRQRQDSSSSSSSRSGRACRDDDDDDNDNDDDRSSSQHVYRDVDGAYAMTLSQQQRMRDASDDDDAVAPHRQRHGVNAQHAHLLEIEHSVLVARRMRKLVKHVERVAKLTELRRRARATETTLAAAVGAATTSADNSNGSVVTSSCGDGAASSAHTATSPGMRYIEEHAL